MWLVSSGVAVLRLPGGERAYSRTQVESRFSASPKSPTSGVGFGPRVLIGAACAGAAIRADKDKAIASKRSFRTMKLPPGRRLLPAVAMAVGVRPYLNSGLSKKKAAALKHLSRLREPVRTLCKTCQHPGYLLGFVQMSASLKAVVCIAKQKLCPGVATELKGDPALDPVTPTIDRWA